MRLETERLFLREYCMDDLDNYYKLKSCSEVWRFSTFVPIKDKEQAKDLLCHIIKERIDNPYTFLVMVRKGTNEFIGEAGIIGYNSNANRCVVGYNLLPEYWNNGFATEIAKGLIRYAYEFLKVERVEALALQENEVSCKVLINAGFCLEGILRNFNKWQGGYRNVCYYGMIKSDYLADKEFDYNNNSF